MANAFQSDLWIIDTAAPDLLTTTQVRIRGIRWVGATIAGHQAVIKDGAGLVKWESVAAGANNVESDQQWADPRGMNIVGLAVPTLGSGKLYIELL